MLSLFGKRRRRRRRARPGTGLKVRLGQRAQEQIARGVPRQAIYNELIAKSRAILGDPDSPTPHLDANAYQSVADEVLHQMMDRNQQAAQCESQGCIEQAAALYEANLADRFEGMRPYERLRLIYTRQKRYADAIRVCQAYLALPDREHGQDKEAFHQHLLKLQARVGRPGKPGTAAGG